MGKTQGMTSEGARFLLSVEQGVFKCRSFPPSQLQSGASLPQVATSKEKVPAPEILGDATNLANCYTTKVAD